jgi:hypothetical protein
MSHGINDILKGGWLALTGEDLKVVGVVWFGLSCGDILGNHPARMSNTYPGEEKNEQHQKDSETRHFFGT